MLYKFILVEGRAFSQPEGLFDWDISAFSNKKFNLVRGRAFSQPEGLFNWDISAFSKKKYKKFKSWTVVKI